MKVKVTIPTSLKDIKLSDYQLFIKTTKDSTDIDWMNKQMVSIFCHLSDEQVRNIIKKDYNNILATLTKTFKLLDVKQAELKTIITYKEKEYGFIPNIDEITVGEQADVDTQIADWSKMDRVMSIIYRPITTKRKGKYLIEDYSGEPYSMDLTMDVVNGALGFFLNLADDLLICTQSFIEEVVQEEKISQLLEENGIGTKISMDSLEETFSNLRMFLNSNSTKP